MQPNNSLVNQRIATISAHLNPPNDSQMESSSSLSRVNCRAKGGSAGFKVAILGAAGGIGQPLAMLMKMNPLVSVLHLYDVVNTPGVTADISHMDTGAVVRGFLGQQQLEEALTGMDLVIIPAGVPRKPGMTRDDLFNINAGIVKTLFEGIARCCPKAIVNLISNPVNSTVPIAVEVLKKAGTFDPKRLLGVTMLDVVRANTFVAEVLGLDPREVDVPVVGGHAGVTILPLLSQVKPTCSLTQKEIDYLTDRIQNGGTEVVEAKAGAGSATLSMAYAAVKFADACLRGLRGDAGVVECAFVASHGRSIWQHSVSQNSSWSWRKLLKLRPLAGDFVELNNGNERWKISGEKYKAAEVWSVIRPKKGKVTWHKLVWSTLNVPKHAFISWLAILNRLPTKDRLRAWGIVTDGSCAFCNEQETRDHLFFGCSFTKELWKKVL